MRILVVGSGGREHALCWTLGQQHEGTAQDTVFCAPGNAGIAEVAELVPIGATDVLTLAAWAEQKQIDLTIVGGEAPLAAGIVDEFSRRGLLIAGPDRQSARLESSKAFAKEFMTRHGIPTAAYRIAATAGEAKEVLGDGSFDPGGRGVVVKADGLAAGKGVTVAESLQEAERAVQELVAAGGSGQQRLVIEERLEGREASVLIFSDGTDYAVMPPAQDHKRIGENDTGPNTGGMGAVTDSRLLDEATRQRITREVIEPTLDGARSEGFPFRGVLFIGLMLTADGPRVLEYNVRFGDPEAQAILVRARSTMAEIWRAIALGRGLGNLAIEWSDEASACVVLAAPGYPGKPETGAIIHGLERVGRVAPRVRAFHAGTSRGPHGEWLTAGGRVLGITAAAATLDQALDECYAAIGCIHWDGMQYRRDIGRTLRT